MELDIVQSEEEKDDIQTELAGRYNSVPVNERVILIETAEGTSGVGLANGVLCAYSFIYDEYLEDSPAIRKLYIDNLTEAINRVTQARYNAMNYDEIKPFGA